MNSHSTRFSFAVPQAGYIDLSIYDLQGSRVATLIAQYVAAGTHSIDWNAAGCPNGIYFARLQAGDRLVVKKVGIVR